MKKFLDKTLDFIRQHREYFISVLVVFVMFNLAMILNANWPYGDTTPLVSDSYQQILPFAEHIFSVFRGEATLFYTNHIGGGFEAFPTIEYMLFNPFYILVLIGGSKNIAKMFTVSWMLMLCFNAIVFVWFAKKYFKKLKPYMTVLFSLLYVFSGYIIQTYSFVTWQIYPALILLVADAFLRLVSDGKMLRFIVFLSWYVINCFSVGVSTAIMLFIVFSAYIFFMFEKDERKQVYARFFVALLVSVLVCVAVLCPAVLAFLGSARSGSILQNLLVSKNHSFLSKISVLFVDGVVLILTILYFIKGRAKQKLDKFFLFALAVTLFPTIFDSCQKLLSGSDYQGFLSRFYFLAEAIMFILALKFLNEHSLEFKTEKSQTFITSIFFATLGVFSLIAVIFYLLTFKTIGGLNKSQGSNGFSLFFEDFVICAVLSLFFVLMVVCVKKSLFSKRVTKIAFLVITILALSYNYVAFFGGGKTDTKPREDVVTLTREQKVSGNFKFVGTEMLKFAANTVTPAQNLSVFSSLTPASTIEFNAILGRVTTEVYVNSCSGNLITDAISGVQYYFSLTELSRPYLTFVAKERNVYLYRNELALSGALGFTEKLDEEGIKTNADLVAELKRQVGYDAEVMLDVNDKMTKTAEEDKTTTFTFTAEADGILYISAEISQVGDELDHYNVQKVDENACLELCYMRAGESYTFNLKPDRTVKLDELKFKFLDYENSKNLILALGENSAEFEFLKDGYSVKTNFDEARFVYVFAQGPSGLEFSVNDGEEAETNIFSGVLRFNAAAGENTFSAKYVNKNIKIWLIVAGCAVILIAAVLILYHFTKFKHVSGVITYAIYVVNCCFLVVFYFLGFILSFIGFSL